MIYVRLDRSTVVDRAIFAATMPGNWPDRAAWVEDETAQIGWSMVNGAFAPPAQREEPPTVGAYQTAIQTLVDQTAVSKQYADGVTLASYVGDDDPLWDAQARAFKSWRSAVWKYANSQLESVQTGQRAQPTIESFLAELPAISWPSTTT